MNQSRSYVLNWFLEETERKLDKLIIIGKVESLSMAWGILANKFHNSVYIYFLIYRKLTGI